jgi:uncharacterized protein (TIGR00730 family)
VRITVFGGSSERIPRVYRDEAYELGRLIAARGWILQNGAGRGASCMGRSTDGALDAGGAVRGIIAARFLHLRHPRLNGVRTYRHLKDRKAALIRADAFVALPGGYGTLDEIGEVLTLRQTGFIDRPIVLLNTRGFFGGLLRWLEFLRRERFVRPSDLRLFRVARSPAQVISALVSAFRRRTIGGKRAR